MISTFAKLLLLGTAVAFSLTTLDKKGFDRAEKSLEMCNKI